MIGEQEINDTLTEILSKKGEDAKFRMWRSRHKKDQLSLYIKISLIESYSDNEVVLTIKPKTP